MIEAIDMREPETVASTEGKCDSRAASCSAYSLNPADAVYLLALLNGVSVPARSNDDLKNLLVNVCKLAESISHNCRDWLELAAIIHGDIHPHNADKLNVPTLRGALSSAVTVPRVDVSACCSTCAFRVGSIANQTEAVAEDVMLSLESGETFFCHDGEDAPKIPCRGFVEARKIKQNDEAEPQATP